MKEDYFRSVIIGGIGEEQLCSLKAFGGWSFQGREAMDGAYCYVFANDEIGCRVFFQKEDSCFRSANVLPIDGENLNKPDYLDGFDSAEEQAEELTKDVLYDFCIQFNTMSQKANENTVGFWWCAIIPSVSDLRAAIEETRQRKNLTGPFDTAEEAVASMLGSD